MAGHGGVRANSGRKSKAEEMGLPELVEAVIGETGKKKLLEKIYKEATETGSFPHQQLLMNYIYGKPKEKLDVTTAGEKINQTQHEVIFRRYTKDAKL
jgi:hypothetical protein